MGNSKRFGEMKATKYSNKLNVEEELQFSAITILVPDDTIYHIEELITQLLDGKKTLIWALKVMLEHKLIL